MANCEWTETGMEGVSMKLNSPSPCCCPFCGSKNLKFVNKVPRCVSCRAVFFVSFSRYVRKPVTQKADSKPRKFLLHGTLNGKPHTETIQIPLDGTEVISITGWDYLKENDKKIDLLTPDEYLSCFNISPTARKEVKNQK